MLSRRKNKARINHKGYVTLIVELNRRYSFLPPATKLEFGRH